MKVTIVPIVIGAFGTITKGLLKGLWDLEVGGRVETIQMTALSRTARILRRVLDNWCHSNSSEKSSANSDVKNSEGVNSNNNNNKSEDEPRPSKLYLYWDKTDFWEASRRYEETCGHLDANVKLSANVSLKNSQGTTSTMNIDKMTGWWHWKEQRKADYSDWKQHKQHKDQQNNNN